MRKLSHAAKFSPPLAVSSDIALNETLQRKFFQSIKLPIKLLSPKREALSPLG